MFGNGKYIFTNLIFLEEKVFSVKELKDTTPEEFLSHKEKFENAIRKAVVLHTVLRDDDSKQSFFEKLDK